MQITDSQELRFTPRADDTWATLKHPRYREWKTLRLYLLSSVLPLMLAGAVLFSFMRSPWPVVVAGSLALTAVITAGELWRSRRTIVKSFNTGAHAGEQVTVSVVGDGVSWRCTHEENFYPWNGVTRVVDDRDAIYLFKRPNLVVGLPARAFPSSAAMPVDAALAAQRRPAARSAS